MWDSTLEESNPGLAVAEGALPTRKPSSAEAGKQKEKEQSVGQCHSAFFVGQHLAANMFKFLHENQVSADTAFARLGYK